MRSKADDTELPGKLIKRARDINDIRHKSFILYPDYEEQRREFALALELAFRQGGWTVNIDELGTLQELKLHAFVDRLLQRGRSLGISVICGMQRPAGITRNAIAQSTHVICGMVDGTDLKNVAEKTSPKFAAVLTQLDRYEFGWYNQPTNSVWKGKVQNLMRVPSRS